MTSLASIDARDVATSGSPLEGNLAALSQRDKALARRIGEVGVPDHARRSAGRDGSATFTLSPEGESSGAAGYLGGSSMPRTRAEALVETFGADGGNAFFPTFAAGCEIELYLRRIAPHVALFVFEPSPLGLKIGLSLVNVSTWLADGRLVLLCGDDVEAALSAFFETHMGYEFPTRMMAFPHYSEEQTQATRAALERSAGKVVERRRVRIGEVAGRLAKRRGANAGVIERVCVLSVDPRPDARRAAEALVGTGEVTDVGIGLSIPSGPDQCHHVARLNAIEACDADAVLWLNGGWGGLSAIVPEGLPSAAWLLPDAGPAVGKTDGFRSGMPVFAATESLRRRAIECGADAQCVERLDTGGDDTSYFLRDDMSSVGESSMCDVAIVADLHDLSAAACGVGLTTHAQLWERVLTEAPLGPERSPKEILDAVERVFGAPLRDEATRLQFLELIERRVTPTLQARACAESLLRQGFDARVFGWGWQASDVATERWEAFPDSAEGRRAVFHRAKVVLCPTSNAAASEIMVNALLSGAFVVALAPKEPMEEAYPQLSEVFAKMSLGARVRDVLSETRRVVRDNDARRRALDEARSILQDRHLMTHRLRHIVDTLARAGGAA